MVMTCLVLPVAAQAQPVIAVLTLSKYQFAHDYLAQVQKKEAEQKRAKTSANSPKNSTPVANDTPKLPNIVIGNAELNRFAVDIKGALLKSGAYRLLSGKVTLPPNSGLTEVVAQVDDTHFPDIDYVLFGKINAINQSFDSQTTDKQAQTQTLNVEIVAEFDVIDTKDQQIVASFTAMGKGADSVSSKAAATVIAINTHKILKELSLSLAQGVQKELAAQLPSAALDAQTAKLAKSSKLNPPSFKTMLLE
jgi:hypothetical protein